MGVNSFDITIAFNVRNVLIHCLQEMEYPKILMGWFIKEPTPFVPEFLSRMMKLDYPKKRIDLLIHNTVSCSLE